MSMLHIEDCKLYCTHCRASYPGAPTVFHGEYKDVGKWGDPAVVRQTGFVNRLRGCPHAGKYFNYPEAVQLMDERSV